MFVSAEREETSIFESPASSSSSSEPTESPQPVSMPCTDVNIVPEHQRDELEKSISNLGGEVAELKSKLRSLDEKRRELLNKIIDIKGSIRVFCRVRPFLLTERRPIREPVSVGSENILIRSAGTQKEFRFDKVFDQSANQEDVFSEVKPIVRSALDGHNVCVLAYGQTGTGKTFTMDGTNERPGVVPRTIKELFNQASRNHTQSVRFSISMLEIYMGSLKDLMSTRHPLRSYEASMKCLNIQLNSEGTVEIEGLTEIEISDYTKAIRLYSKGRRARSTSWTNVNDASSRSHCLTRITIFRGGDDANGSKTEVSKLWMIDLGGSERLLKTGATGQTLDEGRAINLSLSALGDVIAALRRKKGHVPYRNSKLTQILRDSLGTGSKVLMLVHVSPCEDDVAETVCSLSFTKRARAVESIRESTAELRGLRERKISELEEVMHETEEECKKINTQLQEAEKKLCENKKILSVSYDKPSENVEKCHLLASDDLKEAVQTPKSCDRKEKSIKILSGHTPRFMTSTVASRQRQTASEKEINRKAPSLRSIAKASVQLWNSQSLSLSESRSRTFLRRSDTKPPSKAVANVQTPETPKSTVRETSLLKSKMVTSSDPNVRITICRHRRRMSNLI